MLRDNFEWGVPHVQTRACHSAFDFAPHCCMQHDTHSEKSHTPPATTTCALLAANDSNAHIDDQPIDQPFRANISIGFWFGFWHLIFWTVHVSFSFTLFSERRSLQSLDSKHLQFTHSIDRIQNTNNLFGEMCVQFVHTQRNYLQYAFDALCAHYRFHLISYFVRFFWACFFSWTKFMCIKQIVCLFRWTIIDFGVRECIYLCVRLVWLDRKASE